MYDKSDFTELSHGPYGLRWSYVCDDDEVAPTVEEAEQALGVKLAPHVEDCTGERTDGREEVVYFAAEFSENTLGTYRVQ